jgi:hypothetical protein
MIRPLACLALILTIASSSTGCSSDSGGGPGGAGGASGAGGTPGVCIADGACRLDEGEPCTCRDCWPRDACEFDACVDDGQCSQLENCACADCAEEPECGSYCVPCSEFVRQLTPRPPFLAAYPPRESLCDPESVALYEDFERCACQTSCAAACENNLCAEVPPSAACINCYAVECSAQLDACGQAVRPDILCNPVTGEPCREGEQCDYVRPVPGSISGFFCFPPPANASLCMACNTDSGPFCENTTTCVDALGAPARGNGACARYCCSDDDCGPGTCVAGGFDPAAPDLGVCADPSDAVPGCDVSQPPPSGGSCASP